MRQIFVAPTSRPIRFVHRGQVQQVSGLPPRPLCCSGCVGYAHCTGTRRAAPRGDCGACTVVVGELDAAGQLTRHTVNSCIQFVPTLDGKVLYTVEGGQRPRPPSLPAGPGQRTRLAVRFCTPGFDDVLVARLPNPYTGPTTLGAGQCTGRQSVPLRTGYRLFWTPARPLFQPPRVERDDALDIQAVADTSTSSRWPLLYVGPSASHGGHAQRFVAPHG